MSAQAEALSGNCWANQSDRGVACLARLLMFLVRKLGWSAGRWCLPPIVLYFVLSSAKARRASRQYLDCALGRPARFGDLFRHFHCFAAVLLDRAFLVAGNDSCFRIEQTGLDVLDAQLAKGGVLLVGAHFGSFGVLRHLADQRKLTVRPLMYRRNAGAITKLIESWQPGWSKLIIDIGDTDAMMRVAETLQRGDMVGMLSDRTPAGERCVSAPFFGRAAPFPTGPLLVAMVLKAPVVLCHAAYIGPRHYHVTFELLQEEQPVSRSDRGEALRRRVARYAAWLEDISSKNPYNWFNLFDFWNPCGGDGAHDLADDRADGAGASSAAS